jgi:hypothetical protein
MFQYNNDILIRAFRWEEPVQWWQHGKPGAEEPQVYKDMMVQLEAQRKAAPAVSHDTEEL